MQSMVTIIVVLVFSVFTTALATFVWSRNTSYPPARLLVLICINLVILSATSLLRNVINDRSLSILSSKITYSSLGIFNILLLLMLSSLFMPQWWEGQRPIYWIITPNILMIVTMLVDFIGGFGWIIRDYIIQAGHYQAALTPFGQLVLISFIVSWLVHLSVLAVSFIRYRRTRVSIALLMISIVAGAVGGAFFRTQFSSIAQQFSMILQTAPLLMALAYTVFRSELFQTTRVALDFAVKYMSEGIVALKKDSNVVYANPAAQTLGIRLAQPIDASFKELGISDDDRGKLQMYLSSATTQSLQMTLAFGVPISLHEVSVSAVHDQNQSIQGHVMLFRDVTEIERRTALLNVEQKRLTETVAQLRAEQEQRSQLAQTVQQLTFPIIPVMNGVLVLPLIGVIDTHRAEEFAQVLTSSITREQARHVLIDLTGVQLIDQAGVEGVVESINAASLLGARCTLIGVRPEIAQSLVAFDLGVGRLATATTLQEGIAQVLHNAEGKRLKVESRK